LLEAAATLPGHPWFSCHSARAPLVQLPLCQGTPGSAATLPGHPEFMCLLRCSTCSMTQAKVMLPQVMHRPCACLPPWQRAGFTSHDKLPPPQQSLPPPAPCMPPPAPYHGAAQSCGRSPCCTRAVWRRGAAGCATPPPWAPAHVKQGESQWARRARRENSQSKGGRQVKQKAKEGRAQVRAERKKAKKGRARKEGRQSR